MNDCKNQHSVSVILNIDLLKISFSFIFNFFFNLRQYGIYFSDQLRLFIVIFSESLEAAFENILNEDWKHVGTLKFYSRKQF